MAGRAAVRVDDDLPAGEPRVAHRPADDELARRVDEHEVALVEAPLVVEVAREDRVQDVLDEVRLDERVGVEPVAVLRRNEDAHDLDRPLAAVLVDLVADRHLRLPSGRRYGRICAFRTSESRLAILCASMIGSGMSSSVSVQAYPNIIPWSPAPSRSSGSSSPGVLHLVRPLDAERDVGRLLVDRDHDAAGLGVEAVLGTVVADLA